MEALKLNIINNGFSTMNPLSKEQSEIQNLHSENIANLEQKKEEYNYIANTIVIKSQNGARFIKIDEIIHIQSDANYSIIYSENQSRCISAKNLKSFETYLQGMGFIRVHQSHLINTMKISNVKENKALEIQMSNGDIIPVSFRKKQDLMLLFKRF